MANKVEITITEKGTAKTYTQRTKGADKATKSLTSSALKLGAAYIGTRGLVSAFSSAIKAAGDAQETISKFEAVFKGQAGAAKAFANDLAVSTKRSSIELIDFLSTLQDTFVPLGFARDAASDLSQKLVTLAVDVASFNNKVDADVIRDFQSALVGNTETVRKYGIVITQAVLEQELINAGLAGSVKAATEAEKAQARYNLILKSTTDAQGDAIRTSGSFNNQMKGLNAAIKDFTILLGNELLPLAAEVTSGLTSLIRVLDAERIKSIAAAMAILTSAFVAYTIAVNASKIATIGLTKALGRTGLGLVLIGAGVALTAIIEKMGLFEEKVDEVNNALQKRLAAGGRNALARFSQEGVELTLRLNDAMAELGGTIIALPPEIELLGTAWTDQLDAIAMGTSKAAKDIQATYKTLLGVRKQQIQEGLDVEIAAVLASNRTKEEQAAEIQTLRDRALLEEKEAAKKGFAIWQAGAYAQAIVDTYAGATASYKALAGIPVVGPALGATAAAAAIIAGLANAYAISQTQPGFAHGGFTGPGLSLAGEQGPELERRPVGTQIFNNAQTKQIMGGPQTFNLIVDGETIASAIAPSLERGSTLGDNNIALV